MLARLETTHHRRRLQDNACALLEGLRQSAHWARYPGAHEDKLFKPSFVHQHHGSSICGICSDTASNRICVDTVNTRCEELGCVKGESAGIERVRSYRNGLSNHETGFPPAIHIVKVGSGDTVMKSGLHRDEVAKQYGVIAFEMEGAGVWDYFPSLVIKGVCDYADSHKNKQWQRPQRLFWMIGSEKAHLIEVTESSNAR